MNFKNKKTYKYSLLLTTTLFVLVIVFFLVWSNYKNFRDTIIDKEQQHLLTIADLTAKTLETFMEEQRKNLRIIAQNPSFQKSSIHLLLLMREVLI